MASNDKYNQMVNTPIPSLIISLSVPTILSQLVTTIYNTADAYFVSQLGIAATGAIGIVYSLQTIIQAMGYGLGMGAGALISRKLGQQDKEACNVYASSAIAGAICVGLVIIIVGLPNTEGLMKLLGSTDSMLQNCVNYGRYIIMAAPVMCSAYVINCLIRSEGQAFAAMIGLCSGGIINIALDPLFINTLNMGVAGAALATVISQTCSLLILLSMFLRGKTSSKLSPTYISKKFNTYSEIIIVGAPTIFRQMMASFSGALLNNIAKTFGDVTVAAVTASNKIYMLVRQIVLGVGQAFQPVAGYNFGADKKDRVKQSFTFATAYGTVICFIFIFVLLVFPDKAVSLFLKGSVEAAELAKFGLRCGCIVLPLLSYSTFVNQMYQVLGFAKQASLLASLRQGIVFVPIILVLPKILMANGVVAAQSLSDLITFLICIPFQVRFFKYLDGKIEMKGH